MILAKIGRISLSMLIVIGVWWASSGTIFSEVIVPKPLDVLGQFGEMIESKDHPWFVGVQFHPELKSRIVKAHPLFRDFIAAAVKQQEGKETFNGNNTKTSVVHN